MSSTALAEGVAASTAVAYGPGVPISAEELRARINDPRVPSEPTWIEARLDRLAIPLIRDPDDVVFTRLAGKIILSILPSAVVLFLVPWWATVALGVPYLVYLFANFGGPMVLMLHAVTHRPLFQKRAKHLDKVITYGLPTFFGMTPGAYHAHHVVMHHNEENSLDDVSGTSAYQRDNFGHFLHYWLRFTLFGYLHLGTWLWRRNKTKSLRHVVMVEIVVYSILAILFWLNPVATAVVFGVPYFLLRFFLMAGNWTEHAFVDADAPGDAWRNSTNLLNTRYNRRCFNAGYHLVHHIAPGLHWTDTVDMFLRDVPKYAEKDSVIFDGVTNNQEIFWKLMQHDYGFLADHLVDLGGRRPSREEKIAFLQDRVRRTTGPWKGMLSRVEAAPG